MIKLYQHIDLNLDFHAIIALDHSQQKPALGGCRLNSYASINAAATEAKNLAHSMSFKAAIHNLPFTGGKTVLLAPARIKNRSAYFQALGKFINELNGNYIAAMDSGVTQADMNEMAKFTGFITNSDNSGGSPAFYTAKGIVIAMETAAAFYGAALSDLHIVIQGVGSVGYELVKQLSEKKARITIADTHLSAVKRCQQEFEIEVVAPESVFTTACDIFSPCALGDTLNKMTIPQLQTKFVIGAANNQLSDNDDAALLQRNNICYLPDYAVNAGGLIYCSQHYLKKSAVWTEVKLANIKTLVAQILRDAAQKNDMPLTIANQMVTAQLACI